VCHKERANSLALLRPQGRVGLNTLLYSCRASARPTPRAFHIKMFSLSMNTFAHENVLRLYFRVVGHASTAPRQVRSLPTPTRWSWCIYHMAGDRRTHRRFELCHHNWRGAFLGFIINRPNSNINQSTPKAPTNSLTTGAREAVNAVLQPWSKVGTGDPGCCSSASLAGRSGWRRVEN
jgi:hypothetical protein